MSGCTAKKIQPFTISTKLSLPKCSSDFTGDGCPGIPVAALDNRVLHQNLNEQVSLYLAQASPEPSEGRFNSASPTEDGVTNEDRVNRNSLSRSIKKITLSDWGQHGESCLSEEGVLRDPVHASCERNFNNNNCRPGKAQFRFSPSPISLSSVTGMNAGCATSTPWRQIVKSTEESDVVGLKPYIQSNTSPANLSQGSPLVAQFSCDVVQAEKWVQMKLQDLKDGCGIQEWDRVPQTLQRDMKNFENTIIKLNQMGEQLLVQSTPSAETRRQLQTLREQWQLLKQLAENQSKAAGGLRNLQEFNHKAEQLEAWIRQKEEKPLLAALLQENADKIQLTRRILDLKQEEQQFQVLHEEMNNLAHKLEKQGKSESRNIVARRKHINKMWLRLRGTLKEHHEMLQLALEAATFLQQADVLLEAIRAKWRSHCGVGKQREPEPSLDQDIRDIASQVMMLDITVSQLTSLHPSLITRVSLKHQEVKEIWAQLQQLLRNGRPPLVALTRHSTDASCPETTNHAGREAAEKPRRVSGWEVQKDVLGSVAEHSRGLEGKPASRGRASIHNDSKRRRKLLKQLNTLKDPPQQKSHFHGFYQPADMGLQQLQQTGHKWNPQIEDALEELEDLWAELRRQHQENGVALRETDTALRLVGELEEAECWLGTVTGLISEPTAAKSLDSLHDDLQKIDSLENQVRAWSIKLRALQEEIQMEPSPEHTAVTMIPRKMERVKEKFTCVQEVLQRRASELRDSLVLTEFLQNVQLEEMLSQRNTKLAVANQRGLQESLPILIAHSGQQLSSKDLCRPLEELQEAVEMLNNVVKERERAVEAAVQTEDLECFEQALKDGEETRLSWIASQMDTLRVNAEALAEDLIQAEKSFATVKSELELLDLQGLLRRQQEIESDISDLEVDLENLEREDAQLEEPCLVRMCDNSKGVQKILEAWKELQKLVLENAVRGQHAVRLRQFFRDYLAIISWTEDTRAQIFSESLNSAHGLQENRWEELESNIETKLKEFEELAAAGWELVAEEHDLSEMIKERMEELQSMLGWVMVRWRAQSSQKEPGTNTGGWKSQYGTQSVPKNDQMKVAPEIDMPDADGIPRPSVSERPPFTSLSLGDGQERIHDPVADFSIDDVLPVSKQNLEETVNCMPSEKDTPKETLTLKPTESPVLLMPKQSAGNLGGTVNLILSIGKKGEVKAGVPASTNQVRVPASVKEEGKHKVSTCLQVKEDRDKRITCRSSSMAQFAKQMTTRTPSSLLPCPGWGTTTCHTWPEISSHSHLRSLSRKGKGTMEDSQLLALQGIVEADLSDLQPAQEKKLSSTWPPKCSRKAQTLHSHCLPRRKLKDYMKNSLARAINAECDSVGKGSEWCMFVRDSQRLSSFQALPERMGLCQHLSLGSILSLELPKNPTALKNIRDAISVSQEGLADRKEANWASGMALWNTNGAKLQENDTSLQKRTQEVQSVRCQKPLGTGDVYHKFPKKERGTWFEEVSCNPSYSKQKANCIAPCKENSQSPKSQSTYSDECLNFKQNQLSCIGVLHEQLGWEWDRRAVILNTIGSTSKGLQEKEPTEYTGKVGESSRVKFKPSPGAQRSSVNAASNTTKVKDPAANVMPSKETSQGGIEGSCERIPPSLDHKGFKSPTKTLFEYELGYQEDIPASSGLDFLVQTPGQNTSEGPKLPGREDVCHPAHELFEEEEEELQTIWNNVEKNKRRAGVHGDPERKVDKGQSSGGSSGKVILTTADNVLVAKFKLPTSVQPLQGKMSSNGLSKKSRSSQCWTSLPSCPEPSERTEVASMGTVPNICPGDQLKLQEESRGINKLLPSKLELQRMEGTLERKHLLQAGGRKANSRSWNTFHTVLMRQTLCFYQEKKDTLKSSMVALPLNLCGAICALETEYTKKTNCFTLQLKDGSKYLLRALTEPLMKEWVTKLQQNSGLHEMDYFQSASQAIQRTTAAVSVIPGLGPSHFLGLHQPLTRKSQEESKSSVRLHLPADTQDDPLDSASSLSGNNQGSAAFYTAEQSPKLCSPAESPRAQDPIMCQEDDYGLVTSKRRSYSFTSATYQKISPLSVTKEPLGVGSSYSVTLYIGEQAPAVLRPRCHSFMAALGGVQENLSERIQGSSPRQKNKSVFRKFFGKKD
ncbi:uncharacterized protein LOC125425723 isoform X2 [Sphaerodactylus townsendi]|uniref:uncharacterized protein LOC125425723 isoform X2 n=1 Tax=Sphaerodactylus townsendi TaxID=933632 RepID=UPI0020262E4D|nr:uncharacterized protein LOC125425723 isoform X2 [Sphaerodactylus townsendi]